MTRTMDRADIGIRLVVLQTALGQCQRVSCRVGHKQVGPVPDLGLYVVLQQPMGDVHGRPQHLAAGADGRRTTCPRCSTIFRSETSDGRTGDADVVLRLFPRTSALLVEGPMDGPQLAQHHVAPPVEGAGVRERKDRVALQLGDFEVRLNAIHDGAQQRPSTP